MKPILLTGFEGGHCNKPSFNWYGSPGEANFTKLLASKQLIREGGSGTWSGLYYDSSAYTPNADGLGSYLVALGESGRYRYTFDSPITSNGFATAFMYKNTASFTAFDYSASETKFLFKIGFNNGSYISFSPDYNGGVSEWIYYTSAGSVTVDTSNSSTFDYISNTWDRVQCCVSFDSGDLKIRLRLGLNDAVDFTLSGVTVSQLDYVSCLSGFNLVQIENMDDLNIWSLETGEDYTTALPSHCREMALVGTDAQASTGGSGDPWKDSDGATTNNYAYQVDGNDATHATPDNTTFELGHVLDTHADYSAAINSATGVTPTNIVQVSHCVHMTQDDYGEDMTCKIDDGSNSYTKTISIPAGEEGIATVDFNENDAGWAALGVTPSTSNLATRLKRGV